MTELLVPVHMQVVFIISKDLDKQVMTYNAKTGKYEELHEPHELNRELLAMLLPGVIAMQVLFMTQGV
jgi:hypothetical protein